VTEESEGSTSVPGSSAADAAPTQAIPRIPKPETVKKAPAKKVPKPPAKPASSNETDKGRPRQAAPPAPPAPPTSSDESSAAAAKASGPAAGSNGSDKRRLIAPIGGPTGRPLTAADYAHTTKGSPASTSVIPAVKDVPPPPKQAPASDPIAGGAAGRRASLRLTHVEPWSVTRLAFAISVAMMIVAVVAVGVFWFVLDLVGVWDQINDSFTTVLSDDSASFNVNDYFGFGRVIGLTLVLSAVNVVLMTALATIAAHLYNLAAQLMGGVEVTLAEDR
jgi:hypothetical protein